MKKIRHRPPERVHSTGGRRFWLVALVAVVAATLVAQVSPPVTVTWTCPTNEVSGTFNLPVAFSSSAAPIVRVEYYRDGVLFKVVTNPPPKSEKPENLTLGRLSENLTR